MLMIKSINLLILFSLLSVGIYASPVSAKPISNTLKSMVKVISTSSSDEGNIENEDDINDTDNGDSTDSGGAGNYIDINSAINATSEGGILRINSGQYKLDFITDKNITIECADVNGYVDIITKELPEGIKIKVGERVTINKEGMNPIDLLWGVYQGGSGTSNTVLTADEITFNVEKDKEVIIKIQQKIKNRLGFHDLYGILKVNKEEGLILSKRVNGTFQTVSSEEEGIYNLGELEDINTDIWIKVKFTGAGEYIMELWADDGK